MSCRLSRRFLQKRVRVSGYQPSAMPFFTFALAATYWRGMRKEKNKKSRLFFQPSHKGLHKMNARYTAILVASLAISGCASITGSEMQSVSLNTKTAEGQVVDKANCTLKNDKGAWEAVTPGFVSIRRSAEDLMVECKKAGAADGYLRAPGLQAACSEISYSEAASERSSTTTRAPVTTIRTSCR
jgi:hypothetical protein